MDNSETDTIIQFQIVSAKAIDKNSIRYRDSIHHSDRSNIPIRVSQQLE